MLVMTLERVSPSLRGELTRWLVEVHQGVYVGRVSAVVRDLLWKKVLARSGEGRCVQAWHANNELGVEFRLHGDSKRKAVDFDGLTLVAEQNATWMKMLGDGKIGVSDQGVS